ncbi:MAG: helix-hairpin-helix domain-containing protein [Motiliproteus sp.]|nr:helix-hairpin-helix domain-containing protein [Motiliproteus sp.]MCW9053486.1 helix-hairpin-helix domain-containing protein [Motiliproteus sp.]
MRTDVTVVRSFRAIALLIFSVWFTSLAIAGDQVPVNINTADVSVLEAQLSGIGSSKAAAIVRYRQENGPFQSLDQLAEVKGIGAVLIDRNRDRMAISDRSSK